MKEPESESENPDVDSSNVDVASGSMQQLSFIQAQLPHTLFDAFSLNVFKYLSDRELLMFSNACKQTRDWTLDEREKRKAEKEKREASALLLAVVQGDEAEVKRQLEINPRLLCSTRGEATDYSGRFIKELTPFQAALCAGDVEMCEMMKDYFAKLENGQAELEKQFNDIFPNGLEVHVQIQQDNVFDFNEILQAIICAPDNEVIAALDKAFDKNLPLHQALEKFRKAFAEKSLSEKVFNPYHLLQAFRIYDAAIVLKVIELSEGELSEPVLAGESSEAHQATYLECDSSKSLIITAAKRDLFWRQVIGYVQRYLSACILQAFVRGIGNALHKWKPDSKLIRSFICTSKDSILPTQELSGLGFDYALAVYLGFFPAFGFRPSYPLNSWKWENKEGCRLFLELCQSKILDLKKLLIPMEQCEQEPDMSDLKSNQARI